MINTERVQKLVDALRSGEYQQGKGRLRDGNKFCCLGVACDVFKRETSIGGWDELEGCGCHFSIKSDDGLTIQSSMNYLIDSIVNWFGFPDSNPVIKGETTTNASTLNDQYGHDFNAIAGAFERTFLAGGRNVG